MGTPTVADGVPLFLQVAVVPGKTLDLDLSDRMMTKTLVPFSLLGASSWSSGSLERPTGEAVLHRPH